jgi:hypothetical protein
MTIESLANFGQSKCILINVLNTYLHLLVVHLKVLITTEYLNIKPWHEMSMIMDNDYVIYLVLWK